MAAHISCASPERGGPTGPDRPDGLVGDDQVGGVRHLHAGEAAAQLADDHLDRLAGLALIEVLAHAQDRSHAVTLDRLHLGVDELVRLGEQRATFRVAADHVPDVEPGQHRRRDLAGEGALVLGVAVLCAEGHRELVRLEQGLQRPQRHEGRAHDDLLAFVVLLLEVVRQLLDELDRLEVVAVHLPVAGDDRGAVGHGVVSSVSRRGTTAGPGLDRRP
jgi:hypothetical protein